MDGARSLNAMLKSTMDKMDPDLLATALGNHKDIDGTKKRSSPSDGLNQEQDPKKKRIKRAMDANEEADSLQITSPGSNDNAYDVSINQYEGWLVPCQNYIITGIDLRKINAQQFFDDYVKIRRPVVLQGIFPDLNAFHKWSNEYLREKAGHQKVMVEKRSSDQDTYGQGNEIPMTFGEFLDLTEKGDTNHYLTTQDVEADEDGRPDLMAPFMKCLKNDFPLVPDIVPTLIPQNINLWMGNSREGSSSGLHHDYHDNLYFVLRGRKLVQLYSPKDAQNMYTRGKLAKVHKNGRINYEGEITTAYGADLKSDVAAKAARAKEEAEKRLEEAELAVKEGKEGAEEALEKAEQMLDAAMEDLIDAETDDGGGEDDDDDGFDDDEAFGVDDGKGLFDNVTKDECTTTVEEKTSSNTSVTPEESDGNESFEPKRKRRLVDKTVKNPNNFSTVVGRRGTFKGIDKYPKMTNAFAAFCELREGDILYIPASWFHEVTSLGDEEGHEIHGDNHLAFNYWFHPPDTDNFDKPYSTDFWPNDFAERVEGDGNISSH